MQVRVELYNSYDDYVRLFMEVVLNIMVYGMLLYTFYRIAMTQRERRNALKFFTRAWNVIDFISNGLLASCCILWWIFVTQHANKFDINLRYDVYPDMQPSANYLALVRAGRCVEGKCGEMWGWCEMWEGGCWAPTAARAKEYA